MAKDVSIRLHSQLDTVEKKRSGLEQENEELRVRLQDLEVARQVLQQEIDKVGRPRSESMLVGSLTTAPPQTPLHYRRLLPILALLWEPWPKSRLSFSFCFARARLRPDLALTSLQPLQQLSRDSLWCQVWPIKGRRATFASGGGRRLNVVGVCPNQSMTG